ncbi:hypothetical protein EXIGLDRAFT_831813 [Exidia glandulosa HHB12029]|uniref:Armadillo-like helical domain-containing protein n=1 Tax=Exidia glandulosa HHB12029 TaxID=1314781 RepID=A0A166B936_EXIGL|nr:hypothetical protein EXIGLDRAFT_831813 [Exidia glandulosa HHB12029]
MARPSLHTRLSSKFDSNFTKLFQGVTPDRIQPNGSGTFWHDHFGLDVRAEWLSAQLNRMSNEDCLHQQRLVFAALFQAAVATARDASPEQPQKRNALETLSIMLRALLTKNFSGWEIMEVLAGSVGDADAVLTSFVETINQLVSDASTPLPFRRRALQIGLLFMCGVNQLSPGAFFIRAIEFLPVSLSTLRTSQSASFSAECALFLTFLANYHKSDAATLNPFLKGVKEVQDAPAYAQLCICVQVICASAVKLYQDVSDDTPPTIIASFSSLMTSLRPDKAFASTHVDTREHYKHLPPVQAVVLFPLHEFLLQSESFRTVFVADATDDASPDVRPCIHEVLSATSYILTHGASSPRGAAYASLCLKILAVCASHANILGALATEPRGKKDIWLCRQREPHLPLPSGARPALASLLDCCILWLRHNMLKRLEVGSYITCIGVLHRSLQYLYSERKRFVYHWDELWKSLIGLLDFLATKVDLASTPRAEELVHLTIMLLRSALLASEAILPTPAAVHQYVYELVRSHGVLQKHKAALPYASTRSASQKRGQTSAFRASRAMAELEKVISYYSDKLAGKDASGRTVEAVMASIRAEVDRDGIFGMTHGGAETDEDHEQSAYSKDLSAASFSPWACIDGLALVPLEFVY